MASQFQDFRKPVVYILEQELRKRDLKNKVKISGTGTESSNLPMYPMQLIRDSEGKKQLNVFMVQQDNNGQRNLLETIQEKYIKY